MDVKWKLPEQHEPTDARTLLQFRRGPGASPALPYSQRRAGWGSSLSPTSVKTARSKRLRWNGRPSRMNAGYPKSWFDRLGMVSLLETRQCFLFAS
jgi:hypothetical protein